MLGSLLGCVDPPLEPQALATDAMRAELVASGVPATAAAGTVVTAELRIRNEGRSTFPADGTPAPGNKVNVGLRWLDSAGRALPEKEWREALPHRLRPRATVTVPLRVEVPATPGDYVLEIDLVQENVAWFRDAGSRNLQIPIRVDPPQRPASS